MEKKHLDVRGWLEDINTINSVAVQGRKLEKLSIKKDRWYGVAGS
jgi:hypothetical protein